MAEAIAHCAIGTCLGACMAVTHVECAGRTRVTGLGIGVVRVGTAAGMGTLVIGAQCTIDTTGGSVVRASAGAVACVSVVER